MIDTSKSFEPKNLTLTPTKKSDYLNIAIKKKKEKEKEKEK